MTTAQIEVKETAIIFSGPMVRAILEGRKTQTRRVVAQPKRISEDWRGADTVSVKMIGRHWEPKQYVCAEFFKFDGDGSSYGQVVNSIACPYGKPGDRLWVRETWYCAGEHECDGYPVRYRVDADLIREVSTTWRTPIFMPRWASRITLEIRSIRVERLQDISIADVEAEGIPREKFNGSGVVGIAKKFAHHEFSQGWDAINGKRKGCTWSDNPWCWAIEFKKL